MKRPDLRVGGRADLAVVTLAASRPRLPDVWLELDPVAARRLIGLLQDATAIAEGNPNDVRRNEDGEAVSWSESVSSQLSAFVPPSTIR